MPEETSPLVGSSEGNAQSHDNSWVWKEDTIGRYTVRKPASGSCRLCEQGLPKIGSEPEWCCTILSEISPGNDSNFSYRRIQYDPRTWESRMYGGNHPGCTMTIDGPFCTHHTIVHGLEAQLYKTAIREGVNLHHVHKGPPAEW